MKSFTWAVCSPGVLLGAEAANAGHRHQVATRMGWGCGGAHAQKNKNKKNKAGGEEVLNRPRSRAVLILEALFFFWQSFHRRFSDGEAAAEARARPAGEIVLKLCADGSFSSGPGDPL